MTNETNPCVSASAVALAIRAMVQENNLEERLKSAEELTSALQSGKVPIKMVEYIRTAALTVAKNLQTPQKVAFLELACLCINSCKHVASLKDFFAEEMDEDVVGAIVDRILAKLKLLPHYQEEVEDLLMYGVLHAQTESVSKRLATALDTVFSW